MASLSLVRARMENAKGIISGYWDLIVFAAMQKARRAKYNECVLSPEKT